MKKTIKITIKEDFLSDDSTLIEITTDPFEWSEIFGVPKDQDISSFIINSIQKCLDYIYKKNKKSNIL